MRTARTNIAHQNKFSAQIQRTKTEDIRSNIQPYVYSSTSFNLLNLNNFNLVSPEKNIHIF